MSGQSGYVIVGPPSTTLSLSDITDCPEYPLQSVPLLTPGSGELTQIVVEWSEVLSYRDTTVLSAPPHCQVSGVRAGDSQ